MQRSLYLMVVLTPLVWAQDVISVRSGLIHRVEGKVTLAGKPVILDNSRFPIAGVGQTLEVSSGFVEVLLTPGAFLRLDGGASFRMLSSSLEDTKIEVLSGTALVEIDELEKTNHISVQVGTFQTELLKHGLYYFDAEVGRLRVFDAGGFQSCFLQSVANGATREDFVIDHQNLYRFAVEQVQARGLLK